MGIALLGSVMNAAYAPGLASVPGVPAEASSAASNSLGEAYKVADQLGGTAGTALHQAARHAFVNGLHVTLFVSAGLLLLGAAMARRLPRVMECPVNPEETMSAGVPEAEPPARSKPALSEAAGSEPVRSAPVLSKSTGAVRSPDSSEAPRLADPSEPRVPATREAIEPAGSGRPAH